MNYLGQLAEVGQLFMAGILGALIGLERERFVGLAGIRTYATVALGACFFGIISKHIGPTADPSRVAAQIVSGIGFLGAGVILRDKGSVKGLTTAATLWATASVGLGVANELYITAAFAAVIIIGLLALHRFPGWINWKYSKKKGIKNFEDDD